MFSFNLRTSKKLMWCLLNEKWGHRFQLYSLPLIWRILPTPLIKQCRNEAINNSAQTHTQTPATIFSASSSYFFLPSAFVFSISLHFLSFCLFLTASRISFVIPSLPFPHVFPSCLHFTNFHPVSHILVSLHYHILDSEVFLKISKLWEVCLNVTHHQAASVALNKLDKQPLMNPGAASILHWFCCNVAQLTFGIQQKSYYFRVMRYSNNIQNTKMPDLDQRFKVCHK